MGCLVLNYTTQIYFDGETGLGADWPQGYKRERRPLITVLDRLIMRDLIKTLLAVLTVIVVIIVSRRFIKILDKAIEGQVSNETLLSILGLKMVVASISFLPAALFMAVLMVLGRMYRDQEMSSIASAGGGAGTIYRAVFLLVFPLSVVSAGLSLYVAPWAEAKTEEIMHQDEQSADIRGVAAGKFSEYSQGDLVFYVEKIGDDKKMHKVFVQQRQLNGKLATINSETGRLEELEGGRYMILEHGERILGMPGALDYVIENFVEYAVRIEERSSVINTSREAVAMEVLWNSEVIRDVAELQRRYSIPLSMIFLSFLAVPLAQSAPRGGVYGNMTIAFLIYFSYGNLIRVSQSWVINETIPVWLGGIGVYWILSLVGVGLLIKLYGWQWVMMKLREKVAR
ncbi:MAG: LPS export ABC transporter permease LptF [Methylobacter sp.]|uniref:LPS export ABC transporter permease LptF n=1 Tax=Methylobacter sp. TaxID=2051955 RepID=UPI00259023D7|nr:LPS export ABC transporter permease LptF [Methylobacter sp.]MCL7420367.1 LPS export ABC transporter permease LptF [Methylobacter sp.]